MVDYDKIKKTFTLADGCSPGVACLISIIKYYDRKVPAEWLEPSGKVSYENTSLAEIKELAIRIGFEANIQLLRMEQLKAIDTPIILFFESELREMDFVVCYGFDGKRFVVGEPLIGLMQYFPKEMEELWVRGIALVITYSSLVRNIGIIKSHSNNNF